MNELMQKGKPPELNRRTALKVGCAMGGSLIGLPGLSDRSYAADKNEQADAAGKGIAEIRMKSDRVEELRRFYEEALELPVTLESNKLSVEVGTTRLIFSATDHPADKEPFYHYAFNIPENKIEAARQWQKERTPLLRRGKKEVIHFSRVNAHSVYFNDPAGNIVEYIARHDLKNSASGEFGPKDILYASEIGLVVDDVPQTVRQIKASLGFEYFKGGYRSDSFTPVGDAHALLILVKRNRLWFPNQKQAAKVHPVQATIRGPGAGRLHDADLDYKVDVKPGKNNKAGSVE
jgi:catechol-2,3-dioxygenase